MIDNEKRLREVNQKLRSSCKAVKVVSRFERCRMANRLTEILDPIRDTAMGSRDARIDAYIAKSKDFAKPILTYLRDLVHATCPEVEETMKWSFPHFQYKGMLCAMASHKEHCSFGFWKGSLVLENGSDDPKEGMGHFGRITELSNLPSKKALTGYIKKAMKLNEDGVKKPAPPRPKTPKEVVVPDDLAKVLQGNARARADLRKIQSQPQA